MAERIFLMNFQKQFDTITGALNIFDMSYLVSGAAMMTVLVYTFPGFRDFIFHYNQVTLSVFVCIVITYILGMICWVAGKKIRYWCINSHEDTVKEKVREALDNLPPSPQIVKIKSMGMDMAYSYMWMKLDKSDNADCRSRFLYISHFWVLRAIYEGLIPSVIILGFVLFAKCQTIVVCSALCKGYGLKTVIFYLVKAIGITWLYNYILFLIIFCLMFFVGYLLAKEAKRCVETQIREVVVAYYNFFVDITPANNTGVGQ